MFVFSCRIVSVSFVCLCPGDQYCGQLYMQDKLSQLNDGALQRVEADGEDYDVDS